MESLSCRHPAASEMFGTIASLAHLETSPLCQYHGELPPGGYMDLTKYLLGNRSNPLSKYNKDELELFYLDFKKAISEIFKQATNGNKFILISDGQLFEKTTSLRVRLDSSYNYISSDRNGVEKHMEKTYVASLSSREPNEAYAYWKAASDCLADFALAIGLARGYKIAYATTLPSPFVEKFLSTIKDIYHRQIAMIHLTVPGALQSAKERVRGAQLSSRVGEFTDHVLMAKCRNLFESLHDLLLGCHRIGFLTVNESDHSFTLAAGWENSKFMIYDHKSLKLIRNEHDRHAREKGRFDMTVKKSEDYFASQRKFSVYLEEKRGAKSSP